VKVSNVLLIREEAVSCVILVADLWHKDGGAVWRLSRTYTQTEMFHQLETTRQRRN